MKPSYSTKQILRSVVVCLLFLFVGYLYSRIPFKAIFSSSLAFYVHGFGLAVIYGIALAFFDRLKNFVVGQEAEWNVEDALAALPSGFVPIADLNLSNRGNIDNVVVGPTGVWALEVKSHKGFITRKSDKLLCNGHPFEKDFLSQVWAEAYSVRDFFKKALNIDLKVQPVLVFADPGAHMKFGLNPIRGVYVIGAKWLLNLLQESQAQHLDDASIQSIAATLKLAKTRD
ncbi:MAG: hypothetical protein A3B31_00595 [Candidatus Komeilibacteria bacterium RIFCSPLOWO2_01_FULL_53_11]|uniref:NERD domain-containing protein n=1 Tax=Candidatus Komeilibacteria bacterium RIFCSPLOWO2_01_FULL_53_11 TaxID=1798552 RepID=A0A1G2BR88_9BACT|nr:MAG: hypothetical protein A3B31_00595 [Candidatus Komeilibacteria bacterium RIFCSPLOWO2_01_FULL_53_11]